MKKQMPHVAPIYIALQKKRKYFTFIYHTFSAAARGDARSERSGRLLPRAWRLDAGLPRRLHLPAQQRLQTGPRPTADQYQQARERRLPRQSRAQDREGCLPEAGHQGPWHQRRALRRRGHRRGGLQGTYRAQSPDLAQESADRR